jgi:hypothetical protein
VFSRWFLVVSLWFFDGEMWCFDGRFLGDEKMSLFGNLFFGISRFGIDGVSNANAWILPLRLRSGSE